ncbi:DNA-binding XRE family transcriptional regulator [Moryella indoligenes]|uniref:DNA-binding XRE family transcriptional regulator n=1 Tax=Moryella indoligenes TaxID=371674 RepID=A0AAE3VCA9_9FIRM|nr:helix-turn-helix transcriptional regulator [Moryella indoligenes]MDQ0153689.1 DNA-binding XRE family transcriptional regulator [Moryella indoligenes]
MPRLQISLEAARVNAKLSQEDVAKKIGKSRQTIALWEAGKVKLDRANFYMLAEIYGLSIDDIFLP